MNGRRTTATTVKQKRINSRRERVRAREGINAKPNNKTAAFKMQRTEGESNAKMSVEKSEKTI